MSNNKQNIKLYTEEDLLNAIAFGCNFGYQKNIPSNDIINAFIEQLTSIQLPSYKEIDEIAMVVYGFKSTSVKDVLEYKAFKRGARLILNKIQEVNK